MKQLTEKDKVSIALLKNLKAVILQKDLDQKQTIETIDAGIDLIEGGVEYMFKKGMDGVMEKIK